jgi:DNA-binding NarL/FixJ family response regulator
MHGLLDSVAETEVVGEAATGDEVVALVRAISPDVILMDIKMPGKNGIDATREILGEHRDVGVLVVTMVEDGARSSPRCAPGPRATCSRARSWPRCCVPSGLSQTARSSSVPASPGE